MLFIKNVIYYPDNLKIFSFQFFFFFFTFVKMLLFQKTKRQRFTQTFFQRKEQELDKNILNF
jgi:hypothetical protein